MVDGPSLMTLQMGSGAFLGYITGYALKKIFQAIMIIVGVFVMGLVGLATTGAITIQWDKLYGTANMGVSRVADYAIGTSSIAMTYFPISAGFSLGFIYAIRKV